MKFSNLQGKKNFFLKKLMRKAENLRGNLYRARKRSFFQPKKPTKNKLRKYARKNL